MDEENHFEIYNLAIHPFRGILLTVDEVSPEQTRLLLFQIHTFSNIEYLLTFQNTPSITFTFT